MKPKKAKQAQAKPQKPLSRATMHALSQLNLAEKAVMECNRIGLVVRHVFLAPVPIVTVRHNALTRRWVARGKAEVFLQSNEGDDHIICTAETMIAGCRIMFSFPKNQPDITIH